MSNTAIAEAVATSEAKQAEQSKADDAKFEAATPPRKQTVAEQKAATLPKSFADSEAGKTPAGKAAVAKTAAPKAASPKKPTAEPQFAKLISKLSQADANTKSLSADTAQARAEKNGLAVTTLKAAFGERLSAEDVRKALIDGGVLKGTVSKITTVLSALYAKTIRVGDIKSLHGAYTIVVEIAKAEKANTPGSIATGVEAFATPAEPIVATTPEQAFEVIFNSLRSIVDGDEMFALAGEYLAKLSNGIDKIVKEKDAAKE